MNEMGNATVLMMNRAKNIAGVREAERILREGEGFRTFWEKLQKYAKDPELQRTLTQGLLADDPDRKPDSVARNVRNWKNSGTDVSVSRDAAIELAFILKLDLQQADAFLASLTESGFRWRDPDEIVFAYALMHGMNYTGAKALRARIGAVEARADALPAQEETLSDMALNRLLELKDERELAAYLASSAASLGSFHNRAFKTFETLYGCLENPDADDGLELDESRLSARDILRTYLYRELVPTRADRKKQAGLTKSQEVVLKNILESWPDESTLSKMRGREIDVTRKVLILLFIATDGGTADADDEFDEEELTRDELFESSLTRLNTMLDGCGMNPLDPRTPFDWLILYAISVDDTFETDGKLSGLLQELFGGNGFQK